MFIVANMCETYVVIGKNGMMMMCERLYVKDLNVHNLNCATAFKRSIAGA